MTTGVDQLLFVIAEGRLMGLTVYVSACGLKHYRYADPGISVSPRWAAKSP